MSDRPGDDTGTEVTLVAALPGMVRLSAAMWWKATEWSITTSVRASTRLLRAAVNGESLSDVLADAAGEVREYLRDLLEIVDSPGDQRTYDRAPQEQRAAEAASNGTADDSPEALRERGAELLRRSADVHHREEVHPAFARILENLAPDEGRILRLLALEGPQPAIDIRTSPPLGIGSEMVEAGINMIGRSAGCRDPDRVHAYLANLYRLGLIWFSREQLEDQGEYQVLEAQPEVQVAMSEAGRTKTVRRSIHLTAFGKDFCETCLPLDTDEIEALPGSEGQRKTRATQQR